MLIVCICILAGCWLLKARVSTCTMELNQFSTIQYLRLKVPPSPSPASRAVLTIELIVPLYQFKANSQELTLGTQSCSDNRAKKAKRDFACSGNCNGTSIAYGLRTDRPGYLSMTSGHVPETHISEASSISS
ncbi:hypothetical protein DER45DRAFT_402921 [Fusarium avenaceum]|nr:hypothetical protein DER45DRAFT_402921 [Fusarium avenaceum]